MIKFIASMPRHSPLNSEEQHEAPSPLEATGALKVVIQSAHIGGSRGWWKRPPTPFVSIQVNEAQAKTGAQAETYDPSWITQTFFLLVKSPKEELRFTVYDDNAHRRPGLLGAASLNMSRLIEDGIALDAYLPLLKEEKQKGDLLCSLFYYPISISPEDENAVGIVRLIVHRGEELQAAGLHSRSVNAVAKIRLRFDWDAPAIHITPRRSLANGSVVWESMHEFLCFDKNTCVLYIDVFESHLEDPVLGHLSICLTDLVEATITRRGPWPLSGSTTGKLVVSAEWKPLDCSPNA